MQKEVTKGMNFWLYESAFSLKMQQQIKSYMKNDIFGFVHSHRRSAASYYASIAFLVLIAVSLVGVNSSKAKGRSARTGQISSVQAYQHDLSPALRDLPSMWPPKETKEGEEREANLNPKLPLPYHVDTPDALVENPRVSALALLAPSIPSPILNFDGIPFPGVGCSCAPPDTNGAVGATQYVQMVNEGYQVFNKSTGASVLGPVAISSLWTGFGGACENGGSGDPVVLYDKIANRWLISQFATPTGNVPITDECIAISQTSDASGAYYRYGFHLGSNFYDYPHLGVWPDGYYMAMNVFNSSGSAFLGPQAFAFDRAKMLTGAAATFVTPGITGGANEDSFLPSDLDGSNQPPAGTANPFVSFPGSGTYKVRLFHADFTTPGNTTFNLVGSPAAGGFTLLCPNTRACVPELGVSANLDGIGDRLMFRLAYRKFGDGHEAVVGNFSVLAGGVAGVRWFELRGVTTAPVVFQESTYQPDSTWRWMGSAAMDQSGNLAVGFSASSSSINPQIRYAGRLVNDPINTLAQGEAHLYDGTGSQTSGLQRWGDYSALTVDPVDDCTFWYTQEYIPSNGTYNWKTRIGSFKFSQCTSVPTPVIAGTTATITNEGCSPANMVIDPNETVTVNFCAKNLGSGPTTSNLTGTLMNTGGVTSASGSQNYGVIAPGDTVCRTFTFTANGSCGGTLTATIHFQDGTTDLGDVVYTFTLGALTSNNVLSENFDGVTAPALPSGWSASNASGTTLWATSTTTPDTAPNDAFVDDPASVSDKRLDSVSIAISAGTPMLTFRNYYILESTYDGGVLEISSPNINGGAFTDITNAAVGGSFVSGGYNGTISPSFSNPLAGRTAWTGDSGGYITTVANLGPNIAGQTVKLRFRMGSDTTVSKTGWRVDTISVTSSSYVCCDGTSTPPELTAAVSRLNHPAVGDLDVNMPLSGTSGVEDRQASTYNIVLTFANGPITSGTAMVSSGTGTAGSPTFSGNTMTVPLTGVANAQVLTLTVSNVNGQLPSASVDLGFLIGDSNADRTVNSADIGQTKSRSGGIVGSGNFRSDVNVDGNLNSGDIGLVKSKSGTALP